MKRTPQVRERNINKSFNAVVTPLLTELRELILTAREQVARAVNAGLVLLNWQIGNKIRNEILKGRRAEYGEEILSTVSKELTREFGQGYSTPNLSRMIRFVEVFPDSEIVSALSKELGWSHFVEILPLENDLKRDFYAELCRIDRWSVRKLRDRIQSMLYERTALSRKPEELIRQELKVLRAEDKLTPDLVFRDPYFLDFLGLKGAYQEKDLEEAILRDIEAFLIELGGDFAFLARQKRIVVGGDDFYIDLLFYHRRLRRLVAVELKLGKFAPADLGQMEFYLRWLKRHEMRPGEDEPIGLVLCEGKVDEQIEVLELEQRGIRLAEYLTELPPREVLKKRLHDAIRLARERLGTIALPESLADAQSTPLKRSPSPKSRRRKR
jgi:predicted nuclease of restriction endonuclease-like (RecB) superfamily